MPVRLEDVLAAESAESRARIEEMAAELRAEHRSLQQLREARDQSQEEIARKLGVQQSAVSKIERRTDLYVSTLRKYVEAVGGKLRITAEFPGGGAVVIDQFHDDE
ncbi:helix-turn-helix transcriptional regulator [Paludisphaera sp.]|uniref:helix-turn-helix domain-containing protein n=1 Tax=Paludisphaera sp. TaxID=2017432 RepID=UPI00301BF657